MSSTVICGAEQRVLGKDRVCVLEDGHLPWHRDSEGIVWIGGREIPLMEAFSRYAKRRGISSADLAPEFEEWCNEILHLFRRAEALGIADDSNRAAFEDWLLEAAEN